MASVQERLKLKRAPTDIWSVREQLCLASSVLKSGDQNWMSVSRSLRLIADKELLRPVDWFSQKSCAQQYAYLLENTDIPKRKKRESGETTGESIVRRLTQDRISELSKILAIQQEEYRQLKVEINLLKTGSVSDEKLQKMWFSIEQEENELEQKNKIHLAWLSKCQQNKESQLNQPLNIQNVQKVEIDVLKENPEATELNTLEEENKIKSGKSSLLTSLLKLPNPPAQIQVSTQAMGSPTIASLLCSSPKVPGSIIMHNVSPQLQQLQLQHSNNIPSITQERSSLTAPTLSMLLEQPAAGTQKALQQQLQTVSNLMNSKNFEINAQSQNIVQTRSTRISQDNNQQISQVHQIISNSDLSSSEISQIISNPIDEVMPKVMQMDKDEINEIIGDIEELIKEEITGSPQSIESSSKTAEITGNLNIDARTEILTECSISRNADPLVSVSNSPSSEISIEDIDSSTSNIAEIIGTSIRANELKIIVSDQPSHNQEVQEQKFAIEGINKMIIKSNSPQELKIKTEIVKEVINEIESVNENSSKINISTLKEIINIEKNNDKNNRQTQDNSNDKLVDYNVIREKNIKTTEKVIDIKVKDNENKISIPQCLNMLLDNIEDSTKFEEKNKIESYYILKEEKLDTQVKENKIDKNHHQFDTKFTKNCSENIDKDVKVIDLENDEFDILKIELSNVVKKNKKDITEVIINSDLENKNTNIKQELDTATDYQIGNKSIQENNLVHSNDKILKIEKTKGNDDVKNIKEINEIKVEINKEGNENNDKEYKNEKKEVKKEIENDTTKKERIESCINVEELDEEEPMLSKLSGGRAMKTYSKKQNVTVDSEPENETGGETADYRAWKKSIMLVYNRLATHKYASIFLRPITEDQAPGYHSIIFRPMDLWTIKKNIDNGTIRSTTHFQRDVMLMFQNAIMFNKYNTLVHKMTLEMQEECLQHMQVLVRVAGEASFRRETRTAANISNETTDNILKRKWTHMSSSIHEIESSRVKKQRKSEND